jgi:hypothetical protein
MGEIAVAEGQPAPMTLIYETDPVVIIDESKRIANALADIIEEKKLYTDFDNDKKYVHVEGWTTLGALVKVFPVLDWSKRIDREGEIVYESRVIAQTLKGEIVGKGESLCSDKETLKRKDGSSYQRWKDEYAVKSMSITRATSKALRIPLGWIMVLAGYEGTPFEEMDGIFSSKSKSVGNKPASSVGKKPKSSGKKPKSTTPKGVDPDKVQDAEVQPKNKTDKPETVDMTGVDLETLKGINKNLDKWIKTCQDNNEPKTEKQVCGWCEDLLADKKLTLEEFKQVRKALGHDVK